MKYLTLAAADYEDVHENCRGTDGVIFQTGRADKWAPSEDGYSFSDRKLMKKDEQRIAFEGHLLDVTPLTIMGTTPRPKTAAVMILLPVVNA